MRAAIEAFAESAITASAASAEAAAARPGAAVGRRVESNVEYIPYGVGEQGAPAACEVLATLGDVELEYAALRRGAAIFDSPHRGTLMVTGSAADRRDLLNRLVTQELKNLQAGQTREAFWLSRKGRIQADLFMIELGDRLVIDVDLHQSGGAAKTLADFIFSEDVRIAEASEDFHQVAVHGRLAGDVIKAACGLALEPMQATRTSIADTEVIVARRDQTGEPGFAIIAPRDGAAAVFEALRQSDPALADARRRIRPIGWHAFNIARIEAGTPLMNIDFGSTNLPHETGVLRERVSFTKGCYVGQEVVARMENLGKPKQKLVGLRIGRDRLPVAGAQVFERSPEGDLGEPIGVVTSSTLSPMLSAAPVAFAMIRTAHAGIGSQVLVNAEGESVEADVAPLRFWPPVDAPAQDSAQG